MTQDATTDPAKAMCPRCEKVQTFWLTGFRSNESAVCQPCRGKAEKSISYLAAGRNCWGRGKTIEEAKENHRKALGKRKGSKWKGEVYRITGDDMPGIDSSGMMYYFGSRELIETVK